MCRVSVLCSGFPGKSGTSYPLCSFLCDFGWSTFDSPIALIVFRPDLHREWFGWHGSEPQAEVVGHGLWVELFNLQIVPLLRGEKKTCIVYTLSNHPWYHAWHGWHKMVYGICVIIVYSIHPKDVAIASRVGIQDLMSAEHCKCIRCNCTSYFLLLYTAKAKVKTAWDGSWKATPNLDAMINVSVHLANRLDDTHNLDYFGFIVWINLNHTL